jgi:exoribonuclease R
MSTFTLLVANRSYSEWTWQGAGPGSPLPTIDPCQAKLYHLDVVDLAGVRVRSPYGQATEIGGVLILDGQTYGRDSKGRAKNGQLLYKCVPYDIHLPAVLVPFQERLTEFSKQKINKYITFQIKSWVNKHPLASITNTLGDVNNLTVYAEYQMICKELKTSLKAFQTALLQADVKQKMAEPLPLVFNGQPIEDRRTWPIFSIDPHGCTDIDDAIGLRTKDTYAMLSIYIANVPLLLEYLKCWPYLSERVATIYLPEQKIPMLPPILSDDWCSLRQGVERYAFALDLTIGKTIEIKTVLIKVAHNYVYEEADLLARPDYMDLMRILREMNTSHPYVKDINDSHTVVEYCMILMNYECSKLLKAQTQPRGIFRSATKKENASDLAPELCHILQGAVGNYCSAPDIQPHELIGGGLPSYTHITSPIRRIVDCINMLELQKPNLIKSAEADAFVEKWQAQLAVINQKTKSIRKIQNEMTLLTCHKKNEKQVYRGVVFDQQKAQQQNKYKYKIYIPDIKLLTSVFSEQVYTAYSVVNCAFYLFLDEDRMEKKVRVTII